MLANSEIKKTNLSINQLIFKKYRLLNLISEGIYGQVYIAININTNKFYAMKAESKDSNYQILEQEAYNLYSIKSLGIPEFITFGRINNYNVLIEELLGKSLFEIFKEYNNIFSIQDICLISIQLLERLEWIHSKTLIHRDLKPQNFLLGRENKNNIIYLTEFGLCTKYCSSKTGKHIIPGFRGTFTGTLKYSSANAQRGSQQSRRDDIESLGYNIIFFMKGELPWEHLNLKYNEKDLYLKTYAMKKYMPVERLCKGLPPEMQDYFKYVRNLKFQEKPNYDYLKNLFKTILKNNGIENYEDLNLSWANIPNKFKKKRTLSPKARLYLKIKNQIQLNKEMDSEKNHTQIGKTPKNNNKIPNQHINHSNQSSSFSQVNNNKNKNKIQNMANIINKNIKSDDFTSITERGKNEKKEQINKPINKEKESKLVDKYQTTRNEYIKKYTQTSINNNCEIEDKVFKYHKISTDSLDKKQLNPKPIDLNENNMNKNINKINNLQMKKINLKINNYNNNNNNNNNSYLTTTTSTNNKIPSNQIIDKTKNNFKKSLTLKKNKLNLTNINNNIINIEQNNIYNTNINEHNAKTVLKKVISKQYTDINKVGKNNNIINQNNKYQKINYINFNTEKNNNQLNNKNINNIITKQYNNY